MKKTTFYFLFSLFSTLGIHAQDNCGTALPISGPGIYTVGVINGTQPSTFCAPNNAIPTGNIPAGEWYAYTPTQNYSVTITSDIAANTPRKDTRVHIYTGNCAALTCFAGDDDTGSGYSSVVNFNVVAGTTYYIAWDNRWLNTTNNIGFSFQLSESTILVPTTPVSYTTQTVATINSGYNICVVDMNGDYKDDIVGISAANMRIHYQTSTPGTYTITDYTLTGTVLQPNWSLAAGDYNKDGFNDIVLGNGSGATILTSNSTGTSYTTNTPGQYIFSQRTNFTDLNNDGNLDIFVCHDIAPSCYYLNNGTGALTFYQSTVTPGAMSIATTTGNYATLFTDFDNDGDSDVFVSKCSGPPCELYRNDENGVYTNISALAGINITPIQTWSSAIADFDNDGDMDIIITASSGAHNFFRNNLDTTNGTEEAYSNITAGSGWDTNLSTNTDNIAYDFDNDGKVDVIGGGNKIMFNQGNNTFAPVTYTGLGVSSVGDLNNDGFLDFQSGTTIRYAVPNGNNWIKFNLQGVQSNRNGIGARVEIHGAWGKQIRDIRSGEGFRHMSTLNAHFGIGTETAVTQVVVIWPSGVVDVINNPNVNQALTIIEGSSPLSLVDNGNSKIKLYPNPTSDILTLSNIEMLSIKNISIISTLGKVVKNVQLSNSSISVSDLSEGFYILLIETEDGKKYSESFLKK
ncbi:FG-GAP-like repeat-containing protein [Flavobacterium cheniae]|uniref:Putative secreted protein (Por secretion system target) n=1 Tax=Flavobacterium cheniae TaxID=295428 RepID=A0A562KF16_9FLAO|nr:FG-GAP-like repeat-containing protein [Flavobacterium cheniae]TDR26076.1 putative secreted protein (Por secretion system target) [Flavobacterium cheniae]TWH94000.1 putative secreted protein (Por secretion system target) [Flavobacterium cheniae]